MTRYSLKQKIAFTLVALAVLLAGSLSWFLFYIYSPVSIAERVATIEVHRGLAFRQVNVLLAEAGLVRQPLLFHLLALGTGVTERIKAGEYELSQTLTPWEILQKLVRGEVKAFMVTLPEDITMRDILEKLVSLHLVDPDEFISLAYNPEFLKSLGVDALSVEGYLFPDTYKLDRTMGAERIIRIMTGRFWKAITPEILTKIQQLDLTMTEALTLASMIGKEASLTAEKPYVSAVFHNRLKIGMKLQSDPTAVYSLDKFSGKIRRKHLRIDTPHNTYIIDALPPTPIGNPGLDSIMAAIYPAQVKYLYFVSKNDGSHHFSETFREHHSSVIKYQINKEID